MQFEAEFSSAFENSFERDHIRIKILDVERDENPGMLYSDVIAIHCEINDSDWMAYVVFGPDCPNGQFFEAVNTFGEVAYVFKLSQEQKAKLTPVTDAAREFRSRNSVVSVG